MYKPIQRACINTVALAALLTGATGHAQVDEIGKIKLLSGMKKACHKNVDDFGDETRPGSAIESVIYTSDQPLAFVADFYQQQFGHRSPKDDKGSFEWRPAKGVIYVLSAAEKGRKNIYCATLSADAETILHIMHLKTIPRP